MVSRNLLLVTTSIYSKWFGLSKLTACRGAPRNVLLCADNAVRTYAKAIDDGCRRALVDIPEKPDPLCPKKCDRRKPKKKGLMYKLKLKLIEGGTNFGTPFRFLQCKSDKEYCAKEKPQEETALEVPPKPAPLPRPRPGLQVSVLGADTGVGQYIAFLLKQCPPIKKLRLYEAIDVCSQDSCTRDLCQVVQDLQHIDTNCTCEAFRCSCGDLERCLQSTDIVLILENACVTPDMSLEERFSCQAPIIKQYADSISAECPGAFIIVCATPIDCMVPLIAETMKETGWYDPRKLLGSLAVPEMRASTLAARALGLEPRCTRVPCICGTEGKTLVPLFSKAVEHFEFATHNAELMTDAVRCAPEAVARCDGCCIKAAELSEAHAIAGLVSNVAYALLCQDVPIVSGFVETDASQIISPARFIANKVELHGNGIERSLGLPKLCESEIVAVDRALVQLCYKMAFVQDWYTKYLISSNRLDAYQNQFFTPHSSDRLDDCAYANVH